MQRKNLLWTTSITIVLPAAFLAKLAVDLTHNKKKIEDLYIELAFAISVLILSAMTIILLTKEKHEKLERSDSTSLSDSREIEEQPKKLKRSASCPNLLGAQKRSEQEVENIHCSIINGQQNVKYKKDEIAAIIPSKDYTIEGIITPGHKYELVDLQLKEDGNCLIKLQNQQGEFLQLRSNTIYMHAKEAFIEKGLKNEQEIKNYLQELKADNDIVILLKRPSNNFDIFDKLGKLIAEKLDCVTWDKKTGVATIEGSKINKQFTIDSFKEGKVTIKKSKSASNWLMAIRNFMLPTVDTKDVLVDITVSDKLVHKEPEMEHVEEQADQSVITEDPAASTSSSAETPKNTDQQEIEGGAQNILNTSTSTPEISQSKPEKDGMRTSKSMPLSSSSEKEKESFLKKMKPEKLIESGNKIGEKMKKGLSQVKGILTKSQGREKSEETSPLSHLKQPEASKGRDNQGFEQDKS